MNKKLVVMIRVRMEVEKNTKKCCVDKDLDTDVGADIALDYQHKIVQEYVRTPYSNLEFSQWTQLFENELLLAALIDRVTFRSFVLNMNCSSSYRIDSTLNHD